ncbi:MAG TPA: ABC transporter permease, partial [candidate division Zixibacteria bacterium]|nr:ABC transporter permease [candidate division Zixibacteria bacterium]
MKALIIFKQFLHDIKKQKLRTFLTTFGIIWGTAATVILVAFGEGMYRYQNKQFLGMGEKLIILWGGRTSIPYKGLPKNRDVPLNDEDVDLLKKEIPDIIAASEEYSGQAMLTYHKKTISQQVMGVRPEWGIARNMIPEAGGRFLDDIDIQYRKRVVFLGTDIRNDIFGEGFNPVGQYITIHGTPFMVVGVLKEKTQNSSYSGRDGRHIFIPVGVFKALWGHPHPQNLILQVADPVRAKAVEKEVFKVLGRRYAFDPKDEQALWVWNTVEGLKEWLPFFQGLKIFLGIIGVFTLMVGGIGTANIMYVVVKERTREIGVKMALGATRVHIMTQIIVESLL